MKCSICQGEIENKNGWDKGNNAQPVNDGRCCDVCNTTVVIPARFNLHYLYYLSKKKKV
jgi:hypothetical protein